MAQLRLALAQVNPTVGDLAGNADIVVDAARQAAERGAHLVVFPEMILTGYPVEDLALRPSFVDASRAALDRPGRAARRRGPRRAARRGRLPRPAPRRRDRARPTAGRPAERRRGPARRPGRRPLRQAPPAQLRRLRRVPLLRAAATGCRRPGARRRRRGRDLRGHLAGRRPGRRHAARPAPGCCSSPNGSPYERNKDDVRLELVPAPCRARPAARWPTSTWSAGRTSWSSTATRSSSAADGRACSRRGPQFVEELLVVDLDLPARPTPPGAARRRRWTATRAHSSPSPSRRTDPDAGRRRPHRRRRPRSTARWCSALRDYVAQERLPLRRARAVRRHRLALVGGHRVRRARRGRTSTACSMPSALLLASTRKPTPPSSRERPGCHFRTVPIAPMVDAFERRAGPDRARRGEPAGAGARHDR